MKTDLIQSIIDLRAAVSFLGEKKSWWNSNFHDASSKDFLDYIFPKSLNSQFSSASISTRKLIDKEVGANYYHLFRLPLTIEESINNRIKVKEINQFQSEEEALRVLKEKALSLTSDGNGGPKNIGTVAEINEDVMNVFSAEYLSAFQNDYKVHPYLN